jgi:hypothetical protein
VFRALAPFAGGESAWVTVPKPFEAEALAVTKDGTARILVANLTEFEQEIALEGIELIDATVTVLDELSYETAAVDPDFVLSQRAPVPVDGGRLAVWLKPYAVAFVGGVLA